MPRQLVRVTSLRDNDNNNDAAQTTVYAWRGGTQAPTSHPDPDHWATLRLSACGRPACAVTSFVATPGSQQVSCPGRTRGRPTGPEYGRFKTGSYPTGPTDGTQIYNGTNGYLLAADERDTTTALRV
jgi:hypothetical protein